MTGTLMYLAPEVLAGQSPSASADVYALGVMLYQLTAGDFRKPLAPDGKRRFKIRCCVRILPMRPAAIPPKRINSAADLVERLLTMDQRRVRRDEFGSSKRGELRLRAQVG